jgi:general secretion pathway protein B
MSLILEALKKAERQHKLGQIPGISSQSSEQEVSGAGRLGWGLLLLLALTMLGVGLYLGSMNGSSQPQPQPQAQHQPEQAQTRPSGELSARPVRDASKVAEPKSDSEVSRQVTQPLPEAAKPEVVAPPSAEITRIEPEPLHATPPKPPPPRAKPLRDMPSGFVSNLPVMNIDIHSYDSIPSKRYVWINMEKYKEEDYLAEGPLLIEILPDGVVLEHMGTRFILPIGNQ